MHFQPYDLTYAALEASIIIAVKNPIPADDLRLAAFRLLQSWPMLSYRLNRAHTTATEVPAKSIDDGFFTLSTVDHCPGLGPSDRSVVNGVQVYNSTVLGRLFRRRQKKRWADIFYPRIFTIQVVSTPNDTVFKFTMQHVAADVLGLYKAAEAFFEGLTGPVAKRSNNLDRRYIFQCDDIKRDVEHGKEKISFLKDSVSTSIARDWLENYDSSGLFPLAVAGREWWNQWTVSTRQQMIHIPKETIMRWKYLAAEAGAKVSRFDLLASWIYVCLADHAADLDPMTKARFIIIMNMKKSFRDPNHSGTELWNPLSPVFIEPLDRSHPNAAERLIQGATQIREAILEARSPEYDADLMRISDHLPGKSSQFRGQGGNSPPTIKLTSWSEAPFSALPSMVSKDGSLEPALVQPGLNYIQSLPIPGAQLHQTPICWQDPEGGYWLAGNLDKRLWERIYQLP